MSAKDKIIPKKSECFMNPSLECTETLKKICCLSEVQDY